jgi:cell division cycle 2-like protein
VAHLHAQWIVHRDLKTSNLLLNNQGHVQVADFGLARRLGPQSERLTPVVVTLWYRAPELLLGGKEYTAAVDVWSVGCILAELLIGRPLLPGKTEIDQVDKIFSLLGFPAASSSLRQMERLQNFPTTKYQGRSGPYSIRAMMTKFGVDLSEAGMDLLLKCLQMDPEKRITAREALEHQFFKEHPLPCDPSLFPSWPATSHHHQ